MDDPGDGARPSSAEEAFALLVQLQESGSAPDFETWVAGFPEFEAELRRLHSEWQQLDAQLAAALAGTTAPDSPFLSALAAAKAAGALASAPTLLREGGRVGEFQLVRPIAEGGMGQVWEAVQGSLGRVVALKFIRPDRVDERAIALFEREARAGGRLNDARIVSVHATGEAGGVRWIAQEYVAGERTLADLLSRLREAPELPTGHFRRMAAFFADVAEAMAAAHAAAVVHRDLKPGNILITPEGRPKVTDFGLARLQDETSLSGELSFAGTIHYMSPEQVAGKLLGIDERTDVFSLGSVLYEALTLRRPFEGETTAEVLSRIALHDPPHPCELRPELPRELGVIALKALEKRPAQRYAMAELAADLRRFLAHEPIRARPPGPLLRVGKWARRHPTATVAALLLVALALSVAIFQGLVTERERDLLEADKRSLATQLLWDIDNGQLDRAALRADELLALDPADPQAHLLLAMGYARFLRFAESQAELDRAMALGFRPEARPDGTPQELYLRALYLIAQRDAPSEREAVQLLQRAIDEAPAGEFAHAWFPLYQVRKALGDDEGAAAALDAFKRTLRFGDEDQVHVVDALRAELRGDHVTAVDELEQLRAQVDHERMVELRAHRHLGRNYLQRYLQEGRADPTLLDRAEAELSNAVDSLGDDASSWAGLGLVDLLRADDADDVARRDALIASAEDRGRRALEHDRSAAMAEEVLVSAALLRVSCDFDAATQDEDELIELEQRLEQLERLEPHGRTAVKARSDLLYYRGALALERGDRRRARELFEQSSLADEHQLLSRVMLAERLYLDDEDFEGALEWLLEARRVWEDGVPGMPLQGRTPWEPRWGFTVYVWLFGTADRAEQPELAAEARDAALAWLERGDETHPNELVGLAEFLATPVHPELLDCARARDIVERFDLQRHFEREGPRAALPILDAIRAACPG